MKPLFGGFFRIAPLAQTIDEGRVLEMVADGGGRFWGWRTMGEGVFGDGGRWVRQPPKGGWIIVAPGWLAYLGLVVE